MGHLILISLLAITSGLLVLLGTLVWYKAARLRRVTTVRIAALIESPARRRSSVETAERSFPLPPPVDRYLRHVLPSPAPRILIARLQQEGTLKTSPQADDWRRFQCGQIVVPPKREYHRDARVVRSRLMYLRMLYSYQQGRGRTEEYLWSGLRLFRDEDHRRLNTSALQYYLAGAVWYPTALLPAEGVCWTQHSETQAIATITDGQLRVSLTFTFNASDEVTSVSAKGRFGRFQRQYISKPWEGRFSEYTEHDGFLVPRTTELGWHLASGWQPVWRSRLAEAQYELETSDEQATNGRDTGNDSSKRRQTA